VTNSRVQMYHLSRPKIFVGCYFGLGIFDQLLNIAIAVKLKAGVSVFGGVNSEEWRRLVSSRVLAIRTRSTDNFCN
jgi:hypothetical protein